MISKVVLCVSESREKSSQVKRLFEHLGFGSVATGTFTKHKIPDECQLGYIEYSYKNFPEIEKLAASFNKKGVIFLVHAVEPNEPFLKELQALYPLTMLTHVGLLNLSVFRASIGLVESKYQYFARLSKVRKFVLCESNAKLKALIEENCNISELILNLLYHHKPAFYEDLVGELDHHSLSDFHFIQFMRGGGGNSIANARLEKISKKNSLAYFANKCFAHRCLNSGDLVNYSVYCLESLNFHPFDSDSLSGVIFSALVTGKNDCAVRGIKLRERFGMLSINDFNKLSLSVFARALSSKHSFQNYIYSRKLRTKLLTNLVKKFGLGQNSYVISIFELFFVFLAVRVNKRKAAILLLSRWDSKGYKLESAGMPLVIKQTVFVELGSLRESKRLFDLVTNTSDKMPDGYMDIVKANYKKHKTLLNQYKFLRVNFEKISYKTILEVYKKYPLSYEINAVFSRKAILGRDFIPVEAVRRQLSNNIRCLNKTSS
ncbi:hypothetical protein VCR14J2_390369 [Vibrio coralliirubri]|nr:hypothetical protein VCR14J2_390369 [Vibrio coralliirubri]